MCINILENHILNGSHSIFIVNEKQECQHWSQFYGNSQKDYNIFIIIHRTSIGPTYTSIIVAKAIWLRKEANVLFWWRYLERVYIGAMPVVKKCSFERTNDNEARRWQEREFHPEADRFFWFFVITSRTLLAASVMRVPGENWTKVRFGTKQKN